MRYHRPAYPGLPLKLAAFAGLFLFLTLPIVGVIGSQPPPETNGLVFNGDWTVSGTEVQSDIQILVRGDLTVMPGGSLTLNRVNLSLEEPTDLARLIRVREGGSLRIMGGSITSSTPGKRLWIEAFSGSTFSVDGVIFSALGGTISGREGIVSWANNLVVQRSTFMDYYVGLRILGGRTLTIANNSFLKSRGDANSYVVSVKSASDVKIIDNYIWPQVDTGVLYVRSGRNSISRNHFRVLAYGTEQFPVLLGYDLGSSQGTDDTTFSYNTIEGAGLTVFASSRVKILNNRIDMTGIHQYGILAMVLEGDPLSLWMTDILVENNFITNFTRYAIRLEHNVTRSMVRGNIISQPTATMWGEYYGIYIIRALNNITVSRNFINMYQPDPSAFTTGISLESRVHDSIVDGNTILDANQNAINVQGDEGVLVPAPSYLIGPSFRNRVSNNTINFLRPITQTANLIVAIVTWLWSNYTVIENNTILNCSRANSASWYNGAAILTSSSYQRIRNNRIDDATYGVVFRRFTYNHEDPAFGQFNRSGNVVYGNIMTRISKSLVVSDESDTFGPIRNVVLAVGDRIVDGLPEMQFESMNPIRSLWWSSANGTFTAGMMTSIAASRRMERVQTSIPFNGPSVKWTVSGFLDPGGNRYDNYSVSGFPPAGWSYQIKTLSATRHAVSVPEKRAEYNVSIQSQTGWRNSTVSSTDSATLSFEAQDTGLLKVRAAFSRQLPPPPPVSGSAVIGTDPDGLQVIVDGTARTSPYTTSWSTAESHTIDVPSPQSSGTDTMNNWGQWSDGGAKSHAVNLEIDYSNVIYPGRTVTSYPYSGGPYSTYLFNSPNRFKETLSGSIFSVSWTWWFPGSVEMDFAVYSDTNCDDVYLQSDSVSGLQGATAQHPESFTIDSPAPGCYWVHAAAPDLTIASKFDESRQVKTTAAPTRFTAYFVRDFKIRLETQPSAFGIRIDGGWHSTPVDSWFRESSTHELYVDPTNGALNFASWNDGVKFNLRNVVVTGPATFVASYTETPVPFTATAQADVHSGVAPMSVNFTAGASGGSPPYSYYWDFADGSPPSTEQNPGHWFNSSGTFVVIATIADQDANSAQISNTIMTSSTPLVLEKCVAIPEDSWVQVGKIQQFTAMGFTADGTEIPSTTSTWSVVGSMGNVSITGLFTATAAGSGTVTAVVSYGGASRSCSSSVTVVAVAVPTVTISSPLEGQMVSSNILDVRGSSTDADLVQVRLVGGGWQTASGTSSWTTNFDITALQGVVVVEARSFSGSIESNHATVTIQVWLFISVFNPFEGETISGLFNLTGRAAPGSVVVISVDGGEWFNASIDAAGSWAYGLDTHALYDGIHLLGFKAVIGLRQSSVVVKRVTVDNTPPARPGEVDFQTIIFLLVIVLLIVVAALVARRRRRMKRLAQTKPKIVR